MANKKQVIELHKKNPDLTSVDIAEQLGCDSAYVRATFYRNGLTLPGNNGDRKEIFALGRAAKRAGLTLTDISRRAKTVAA